MRQIAIFCASLLVLLIAAVGVMFIFDVISVEFARTTVFKWGAALAIIALAMAVLSAFLGGPKSKQD